jgi:hypothetical protein
MLVQQVLYAVDAETLAFGVGKQNVSVTSLWLTQPGFQDDKAGSGDGRTAFFAPLSNYPHVGTGSQDDVLALESGHLREAQAGLYGQQYEGVITPARPGVLIGGGQQDIDFGTSEKLDQGPGKTLAGDGQHTLDLRGVGRRLESCKTKEGVQSCQA